MRKRLFNWTIPSSPLMVVMWLNDRSMDLGGGEEGREGGERGREEREGGKEWYSGTL